MKLFKTLCIFSFVLVISACGGSSGTSTGNNVPDNPDTPTTPTTPPPPASTFEPVDHSVVAALTAALQGLTFEQITQVANEHLFVRNPQNILASGLQLQYPLESVSLNDVRYEYQRVTQDMYQTVKDALNTVNREDLTTQQQLNFDIYNWHIDRQLESRDFIYFDYQGTYFMTGAISQLPRFFSDLHPLETETDAQQYVSRLQQVDDVIEMVIENLKEAETNGIIEPAITLQAAINYHNSVRAQSVNNNPYVLGLTTRFNGDNSFAEYARNVVLEQINPAYVRLTNFLNDQLTRAPQNIGVGQFEQGEDYYQQRLNYHTTTAMTAEQIHQLGLQELSRVHQQLRIHFQQLGYPEDESWSQWFSRVASDGGFIGASKAKETYEAIIDDAENRMLSLFHRLPQSEVVVIGGNSGGFYISPATDGTRPGAFYAATTSSQAYYQMPSLAYHEAMPGHHMQIALMQELDIPEFRHWIQLTGFTEGWALYAERLAYDDGWYADDVYGDIGRLFYEALRAARLVVDTGIHVKGWSFDQAAQYLVDKLGMPLNEAQGNIGRYSIYTGQATGYMVGMLKILELRTKVQDALGNDFNIADFHSLILEQGSMPLSILEQQVDNYIAGYQADQG